MTINKFAVARFIINNPPALGLTDLERHQLTRGQFDIQKKSNGQVKVDFHPVGPDFVPAR